MSPADVRTAFSALLLAILFLFSGAADADAAARTQKRRPTDEQREFASFIDGFFAGVRKDWHIPGMAFVAVRNGEILYLKGYGTMDSESDVAVTPDRTLFRVGSISKLVTATALLQLVEKGRLSLDEDVNFYLRRWKLPQTFDDPVTLRHLLTHTAGFDTKKLEVCAPTSADERNYAARLQKVMPARYAPPGRYYSYSNMGYSLVGSIIERYSRQNFTQAIQKYIFQPLGMTESTFSPTADQMGRLAPGHAPQGNAVSYKYYYVMPAIGMSTTAADMGRFMLAQLGDGRIGKGRVLQPMYAGSMLRRHFSPHPLIDGTGLAYFERRVQGLRTLQQIGNMDGYSSFLVLIPEKNFGLFYAANVENLDFSDDLSNAVAGRFLLSSPDRRPTPATVMETPPAEIQGYYRKNNISRHTAEKIMALTADQLHVKVVGTSVLLEHTRKSSAHPPQRWVPAATSSDIDDDYIFRQLDENGNLGNEYMYFQRDEAGDIRALVLGSVRHTYDRLPPYETHPWQLAFLFTFAVVALISCFGTMLGMAINKSKLPWEKGYRSATELWSISLLFCLIQGAFIVGMAIAAFYMRHEYEIFVPYQVKALFVIPLTGGFLLAWFWFRLFANALNPEHHWAEKIFFLALVLIETGYILFLADWRLLGFLF